MQEEVKEDIVNLWNAAFEYIEEGDFVGLRALSNHTIHNASIFHDELSVTAGVIVYSLSKMTERGSLDSKMVLSLIMKMLKSVDSETKYHESQRNFLEFIKDTDIAFSDYLQAILQSARIKKGWKVYDHGLSLGASAHLLGVSQWDLMDYIGNTKFTDIVKFAPDVRSRIKYARSLFK